MKQFLSKFGFYVLILITIIAAGFTYLNIAANNSIRTFKIPDTVNIICIGDSHVEQCVNDSMIPRCVNLAKSSESFIYSYFKLLNILETNPHIDTVILGISYHNFSDYYDEHTYSHNSLNNYFYILPLQLQFESLYKTEDALVFLIRSFNKIIRSERILDWTGGFNNHKSETKFSYDLINNRIKYQYYNEERLRGISESSTIYFDKIIEVCRQYGICLIPLSTPLHPHYENNVPNVFKNNYNKCLHKISAPPIEFTGALNENENFLPDGDHVSDRGAIIATQKIIEKISKKK